MLTREGDFRLVRQGVLYLGKFNEKTNAVIGTYGKDDGKDGPGMPAMTGNFVMELSLQKMHATFREDADIAAAEAARAAASSTRRREAVADFKARLAKVQQATLGASDAGGGDAAVTFWSALYVYGSGRSDTVRGLIMHVAGKTVSGGGMDAATGSEYTWKGTFKADGAVELLKVYPTHTIAHQGQYFADRSVIRGTWTIEGKNAAGGFQMNEVRSLRSLLTDEADPAADALSMTSTAPPLTPRLRLDTMWNALYLYGSGRSDEVSDLVLHLNMGKIAGIGSDGVGSFLWTGELQADNTIVMDKRYDGKHCVRHTGTYNPTRCEIRGTWQVQGTTLTGGFHMTEMPDARTPLDLRPTGGLQEITGDIDGEFLLKYKYGGDREDEIPDVAISVSGSGDLVGAGTDQVGDYSWQGKLERSGSTHQVVLRKAYVGKHTIMHEGVYDPATYTFSGSWEIENVPSAKGTFTLAEKVSARQFFTTQRLGVSSARSSAPSSRRGSPTGTPTGTLTPATSFIAPAECEHMGPLGTFNEPVRTFWDGEIVVGSAPQVQSFPLEFRGQQISYSGHDANGPFTWTGTVDPTSGEVKLTKDVPSGMTTLFTGTYDAINNCMKGTFTFKTMSMTGTFKFLEKKGNRIDLAV